MKIMTSLSRKMMWRKISRLFEDEREVKQVVALAGDHWTSVSNKNWLGVTVAAELQRPSPCLLRSSRHILHETLLQMLYKVVCSKIGSTNATTYLLCMLLFYWRGFHVAHQFFCAALQQ